MNRNAPDAEIRWLLRPLCEAGFLRLYLEADGTHLPVRCFEQAFFHLACDEEHPAAQREGAWRLIQKSLEGPSHPTQWYIAVLHLVWVRHRATVLHEARSWALPDLFAERSRSLPPNPLGYHETHCHLGGAVPYLSLWLGWLGDARRRSALKKKDLHDGPWKRTFAELAQDAVALRRETWPDAPEPEHTTEQDEAQRLYQMALSLTTSSMSAPMQLSAVRYLATCAALRRQVLYHRGETGLSPFVGAYDGYRKLQKPVGELAALRADRENMGSVLRRFAEDSAVALELRPTLESTPHKLRRKLRNLIDGYLDYCIRAPPHESLPPLGIVPSLFKQEKAGSWHEQSKLWCAQVQMLTAALDDDPVLRWFVVGLDAAGQEMGCPPQALRDAFALVHDYNHHHHVPRRPGRCFPRRWLNGLRVQSRDEILKEFSPKLPAARLGLTIHAGEDFDDPVTGLRHIWESIELLDLQPGDRVGHALVAGLSANMVMNELLKRRAEGSNRHDVKRDSQAQKDGQAQYLVCKPRGTHLLDLAWEQRLQDRTEDKTSGHRLACALPGIFETPARVDELAHASHLREPAPHLEVRSVRYHRPDEVQVNDREWVLIDAAWCERYEALRRQVLRKLRDRDLVVESCPTSNCIVAHLREAPILSLLKVDPALRVVLATDDPGLLDCYPAAEFERHLGNPGDQQRVIRASRLASFVFDEPDGVLT